MDSDSVSPGSNPGSPAKLFKQNQSIGRLDKPDIPEQPVHIGRTKVGTVPSREELGHWWFVARGFPPWSRRFWLGLLHDTVEDGYLPRWLLAWPALDAITRRDGEQYAAYIERVAGNPHARAVKLRDLEHNLTRNAGPARDSLRRRYLWAHNALASPLPVEGGA